MKSQAKILIIILFIASVSASQVCSQNLMWQKCLGGSGLDYSYASQQTAEGDYILCGFTDSNNGNVSGLHGGEDIWVQKLDDARNLLWQKCLGGSGMDNGWDIHQISDGNYILTGFTNSNDGDVSGNHGYYDAWIAKIDTSGALLWQKCYGGNNLDEFLSVQQTSDGGFIACGLSNSTNGQVTNNHGGYDFWVVKVDVDGNLVWQKCLGGSADDYGQYAVQTYDGGYIVAGKTGSGDGDVSGYHGNYDLWIVKLDANGNILWQKALGGSEEDGATQVLQTQDGGFITVGYALSTDGNVSGNHGSFDFWTVKLDASGNIEWQNCLGGSGMEIARSIQQTPDGGYIAAGSTGSNNGDIAGNHGGEDGWIVKLDSAGNIIWQKCLGGDYNDYMRSVTQTFDGGYFAAGYTFSDDGDVTGNHGTSDSWAVKLTGVLNNPEFSPPDTTSVISISFTITAAPGATIYYTTDGTDPVCDGSLSGISPLTLTTPAAIGTYVYKAIACATNWVSSGVSTGTYTMIPTSIKDSPEDGYSIFIYPNPTSGILYVTANNMIVETVILINTNGQNFPISLSGIASSIIDLSSYPNGNYFLKISGKEKLSGKCLEKTAVVTLQK